ncbi:hypothetical protein SRABI05_03874 [Agrobacterium fabrum]|nr:hypothetical protein At12D13_47330 [Agrobacterium fabrum]CAH0265541.1 hypothetical protein SRABI46_03598 [Agrobacterium fabrum]CAH0283869.1 hypothetical protein SRABI05_03874 [Agrobacterium fabrum]
MPVSCLITLRRSEELSSNDRFVRMMASAHSCHPLIELSFFIE